MSKKPLLYKSAENENFLVPIASVQFVELVLSDLLERMPAPEPYYIERAKLALAGLHSTPIEVMKFDD